MKGRLLALLLLTLGAFGAGGLAASAATVRPPMLAQLIEVNFISVCKFSHRAPDDPIVFPRQPGRSHDHSFFGNRSTNAFSTTRSLRRTATTCSRRGDTSAYWAPTLLQNGNPVTPDRANIYYRRLTFAPVEPFPAGLRMIAGDSHALRPQKLAVTSWSCGFNADFTPPVTYTSNVPICPDRPGSTIHLHVHFPDCWDGFNLDSRDHKRYMAYSTKGRCPLSHPVPLPALTITVVYPIRGGGTIILASGGQHSAHADFFNAWDPGDLAVLVASCLNELRTCGLASDGPVA